MIFLLDTVDQCLALAIAMICARYNLFAISFHLSIKDTTWTSVFISLHLWQSFTLVQIKSQTLSHTEGKHYIQATAVHTSCSLCEKQTIYQVDCWCTGCCSSPGRRSCRFRYCLVRVNTYNSPETAQGGMLVACWSTGQLGTEKAMGTEGVTLKLRLLRVVERQGCSPCSCIILFAIWQLSM